MTNSLKILANYLPQYYATEENDKWWGEGYTDWVAVKKCTPLFDGHRQPRTPLSREYYSLDNVDAIRWQAELARSHGIDGFAIYHYWFSKEKNLLSKPPELLLANKDIEIDYLFLWDNCSWKRTWSNVEGNDWAPSFDKEGQKDSDFGLLAELEYGGIDEWCEHFQYLLPFFCDKRYVKINNKPVFGFMKPGNDFQAISKMVDVWDAMARECGFDGIHCMSLRSAKSAMLKSNLPYGFMYSSLPANDFRSVIETRARKFFKVDKSIRKIDYDVIWRRILAASSRSSSDTILSGIVGYDDTPRRGEKGCLFVGDSSEKFEKYISQLMSMSLEQDKDLLFISAWNEWGEGMYLEPDATHGMDYLDALLRARRSILGEEPEGKSYAEPKDDGTVGDKQASMEEEQ